MVIRSLKGSDLNIDWSESRFAAFGILESNALL